MCNGECIEVAVGPDAVLIRDSKDQRGPVLSVAPAAWHGFVSMVRAGYLDAGAR